MSYIVAEVEVVSVDKEKGDIISIKFATPSMDRGDLDKIDTIARAIMGYKATRGGFIKSNELQIDFLVPPEKSVEV